MTATGQAYADGPEVWRADAGVEWSYWDLRFALLCVRDHGGDWDGLDAAITAQRRFDGLRHTGCPSAVGPQAAG